MQPRIAAVRGEEKRDKWTERRMRGSILPVMEGKSAQIFYCWRQRDRKKRRIKAELSQEDKQTDFSDLDYTCTEDSKASSSPSL